MGTNPFYMSLWISSGRAFLDWFHTVSISVVADVGWLTRINYRKSSVLPEPSWLSSGVSSLASASSEHQTSSVRESAPLALGAGT